MRRLLAVVAPTDRPLVESLLASGLTVDSLVGRQMSAGLMAPFGEVERVLLPLVAGWRETWPAVRLNVAKTLRATLDDAPARDAVGAQLDALAPLSAQLLLVYSGLRRALRDGDYGVSLVTATDDPLGRVVALAASGSGVPLVHVRHGSPAIRAEDAWTVAEMPGDWLLLPGERDRAWWQRCAPSLDPQRLLVTGQPAWDTYAQAPRRDTALHPLPTVIWLCETGANAAQTPAVWRSRAVPELAWQAFCAAAAALPQPCRVILKARPGEDETFATRWQQELAQTVAPYWNADSELLYSEAVLPTVLPACPPPTVVIGQDSNGLVEALCAGHPAITITRPGGELFDPAAGDAVLRLDGPLERAAAATLAQALRDGIVALWDRPPPAEALRRTAGRLNRGIDGLATARVVAAVTAIVRGDDPHQAVDAVQTSDQRGAPIE